MSQIKLYEKFYHVVMSNKKTYLVDERTGEHLKALRRIASAGGEIEVNGKKIKVTRKHVIDLDNDQYTLYDIKDILSDKINDDIALLIMKQPKQVQERLLMIKKQREKEYPYKPPFASADQLQDFISMIKEGAI